MFSNKVLRLILDFSDVNFNFVLSVSSRVFVIFTPECENAEIIEFSHRVNS